MPWDQGFKPLHHFSSRPPLSAHIDRSLEAVKLHKVIWDNIGHVSYTPLSSYNSKNYIPRYTLQIKMSNTVTTLMTYNVLLPRHKTRIIHIHNNDIIKEPQKSSRSLFYHIQLKNPKSSNKPFDTQQNPTSYTLKGKTNEPQITKQKKWHFGSHKNSNPPKSRKTKRHTKQRNPNSAKRTHTQYLWGKTQ